MRSHLTIHSKFLHTDNREPDLEFFREGVPVSDHNLLGFARSLIPEIAIVNHCKLWTFFHNIIDHTLQWMIVEGYLDRNEQISAEL